MEQYLQYVPSHSIIDPCFWHNLAKKKIDSFALDDSPVTIYGFYTNASQADIPPLVNIDYDAFESKSNLKRNQYPIEGLLQNMNTLEDFKKIDKNYILNTIGEKLWIKIKSGEAIEFPGCMNSLFLLTFADIKKYRFYTWCAFPSIRMEKRIKLLSNPQPICSKFNSLQISSFMKSYDELSKVEIVNFFFITQLEDDIFAHPLRNISKILPSSKKISFVFCDPSNDILHPGWPLRNYLLLIYYQWHSFFPKEIEILCLREHLQNSQRCFDRSIFLHLESITIGDLPTTISCVGWEKNDKNQLAPKVVDLSSTMDPLKLAKSAVDLNLKLMKWRLVPDLPLEAISSCKCLLLGAGTLACNVARNLLGWGIKQITFVDNSRVSFSNPVRQSLFNFDDALEGGGYKAIVAAAALKRIHPHVIANGVVMTVPMPGHSISENMVEQVHADVTKLEELIDNHDAIFLLMDTRESRWLPTLLGKIKNKIVISSALGFDSYLVVRHGISSINQAKTTTTALSESLEEASAPASLDSAAKETSSSTASSTVSSVADSVVFLASTAGHIAAVDLGCYFCNDVVAPGNSTMDRTLDQQCTVTRPGVSMLAAATSVEMLVSLLTNPFKGNVGAYTNANNSMNSIDSVLGLIPHQVRGFLSKFETIKPTSQCFDKCTACSKKVLDEYKKDGFKFLLKVFDTPKYLEDLTGLTQMHADTNDSLLMNLSDADSDEYLN